MAGFSSVDSSVTAQKFSDAINGAATGIQELANEFEILSNIIKSTDSSLGATYASIGSVLQEGCRSAIESGNDAAKKAIDYANKTVENEQITVGNQEKYINLLASTKLGRGLNLPANINNSQSGRPNLVGPVSQEFSQKIEVASDLDNSKIGSQFVGTDASGNTYDITKIDDKSYQVVDSNGAAISKNDNLYNTVNDAGLVDVSNKNLYEKKAEQTALNNQEMNINPSGSDAVRAYKNEQSRQLAQQAGLRQKTIAERAAAENARIQQQAVFDRERIAAQNVSSQYQQHTTIGNQSFGQARSGIAGTPRVVQPPQVPTSVAPTEVTPIQPIPQQPPTLHGFSGGPSPEQIAQLRESYAREAAERAAREHS